MAAFATSNGAYAIQCYGTITAVYLDSQNNLPVRPSFRGDWLQICNVVAPWNSIDPITCRGWHSMVMTLRVTQELAMLNYNTSAACDSLATYGNAPAPTIVMCHLP